MKGLLPWDGVSPVVFGSSGHNWHRVLAFHLDVDLTHRNPSLTPFPSTIIYVTEFYEEPTEVPFLTDTPTATFAPAGVTPYLPAETSTQMPPYP